MNVRKIELMHLLYGKADGKCKGCRHFVRYEYRGRMYSKCKYYGMSHSEATDWSSRNVACGLFNTQFKEEIVYEIMTAKRSRETIPDDDIPGQMELDFGGVR